MSVLPIHALVLLLMVASVTYADKHCKPPARENRQQKFIRQHYDNPKTPGKDYCDKMMQLQCMTNREAPQTRCKETNSFIHATMNQIQAVCGKGGEPYQGSHYLRVSLKTFSVTTCNNKDDLSGHSCEYSGSETTRKIVIGCRSGLPVHFDEGIVVPN